MPTLLLRGGLSDVLTEEGARHFLELCPSAEYVQVDRARHMLGTDRNDRFTDAVLDFLGRHVPVENMARAPDPC
jgi:non-heme chloroperoxidase